MIKKIGLRHILLALIGGAISACSVTPKVSTKYVPTSPEPQLNEVSSIPVEGFSTCRMRPEDFRLLTDIAAGRLVPNTESSKEGGRLPLSVGEMNEWSEVISRMENVPAPLVIDKEAPRTVFVAVFDGTWNDRDEKTEPLTVPGHLSLELERMAAITKGVHVKYYHGVGTRVSKVQRLWEGATGAGTRERAESALSDLRASIAQEGKIPHVYAIGFSRGAASARHFLNLADEVLQADQVAEGGLLDQARSFALLFDTVATGQTSRLELGIPRTTASVFHFVATRERRLAFPVVSLSSEKSKGIPGQSLHEIELPGAHSGYSGAT